MVRILDWLKLEKTCHSGVNVVNSLNLPNMRSRDREGNAFDPRYTS